jgi:hypothetical protein
MKPRALLYRRVGETLTLLAIMLMVGCDSALPSDPEPRLVIEGFIDTGRPLPAIRLSRTLSVQTGYDSTAAAVDGADVFVRLGAREVTYIPDETRGGLYRPIETEQITAMPGDSFALDVRWQGAHASGGGTVPPSIKIYSSDVRVPDEPVSAVLLDSLALSDSLSVGAEKGYIYPIEVSISWYALGRTNHDYWVRAQLRPYATFSSTVVDLFLRSEEVFPEEDATLDGSGIRTWTGVYAVGVDAQDDPLPEHALRVALLRSGREYAHFAATRHTPERREPASNLQGAVGIFTAISVDSTRVQVGTPP